MSDSEETSRISIERNHDFEVELTSYPGSGAKWQLVPQADTPRLVREVTHLNEQSIGAAATQVFTFYAEAPGAYVLQFELKRVWEPAARNRKEITVEVF